jgi:hypothetical protein
LGKNWGGSPAVERASNGEEKGYSCSLLGINFMESREKFAPLFSLNPENPRLK